MPPLHAYQGAVTAGHPLAAQAGLRLLMAGGNAVDAAVATAASLSVVMPDMIGPFGYGFALIAMTDQPAPVVLAPGLLYRAGKPWLAIGGAGAETTMSGVLQPILNVIDFGMEVQAANDAARFRWGDMMYYTLGTQLRLEAGIGEETRRELADLGHDIVALAAEPKPVVGATNALLYDAASGLITTSASNRGRDAAAAF